MRVLVDANVIGDALLKSDQRPQGDRASAQQVLQAISLGRIVGVITPPIFVFACHIVKPRRAEHPEIVDALEYLLDIMEWAPVTPDHCRTALASSFKDVEDGIEYFACKRLDAIVTRDKKDFEEHVPIPVLTAAQFVRQYLK